ncbi:MAG: ScpA family protein [Acidimicrobiales bacterium]|nr:ScpA family protein [Acidimicrobiales bacterium]
MSHAVETPVFQGPFDLLLHLILQDEVDLYEVRLSDIVDAYLAELERMEAMDLDLATEFVLIAATLIELKSKRLLPDDDDIDLDEELALWEERDLLLSRLVECKTFKDAAAAMGGIARDAGRSYPRTAGVEERFLGLLADLLEHTTADDVRSAFLRAVAPKPTPQVSTAHIHQIRVTVTDAVVEMLDELPRVGRASFADLTDGLVERIEVIVRFLAVLELFKQGWIDIEQPHTLGGLEVVWLGTAEVDEVDLELVDAYDG